MKIQGFNLVREYWSPMMGGNGVSGTIRTTPGNHYVASIDTEGDIFFSKPDAVTKDINLTKVAKAFNAGKIPDKETSRY